MVRTFQGHAKSQSQSYLAGSEGQHDGTGAWRGRVDERALAFSLQLPWLEPGPAAGGDTAEPSTERWLGCRAASHGRCCQKELPVASWEGGAQSSAAAHP